MPQGDDEPDPTDDDVSAVKRDDPATLHSPGEIFINNLIKSGHLNVTAPNGDDVAAVGGPSRGYNSQNGLNQEADFENEPEFTSYLGQGFRFHDYRGNEISSPQSMQRLYNEWQTGKQAINRGKEQGEEALGQVERPPMEAPAANPWESDPIIKPAEKAGPKPWEQDPIVKAAPQANDEADSMQAHVLHEVKYGEALPEAGQQTESDSMAPSLLTGQQIPEGQYNQEVAKYGKYQDWLQGSGAKDTPQNFQRYSDAYDAENLRQKVGKNTEQWQQNKTAIEGFSPEDMAKGNRGYLGDVTAGVRSASGKVLATAAHLAGEDDFANQLNRQQSEEAKAMAARPENGFVHDRLRGLVDGAMTMALTAPLGGTGTLATFGAEAASQADTEAIDAGMSGWKRTAYVGTNAAIATFTASIMQKLGMGAGGAPVSTATVKGFMIEAAKQFPSMFGMNVASTALKKMAGVDKTEWTPEEVGQMILSSAVDTIAFHALGAGQNKVEEFIKNPSRSNAVDAGFGVQVSKPVREQIAQDAAAQMAKAKADLPDLQSEVTERMKANDETPNRWSGNNDYLNGKAPIEHGVDAAAKHLAENPDHSAFLVENDNQNQKGINETVFGKNNDRADREALGPWSEIERKELANLGGKILSVKSGGDEKSHVVVFDHKVDPQDVREAMDSAGAQIQAHGKGLGIPVDLENPRAKMPRYKPGPGDTEGQSFYAQDLDEYHKAKGFGIRTGVTELVPGDTYESATKRTAHEQALRKEGLNDELEQHIAAGRAEFLRQQSGRASLGSQGVGGESSGQPSGQPNPAGGSGEERGSAVSPDAAAPNVLRDQAPAVQPEPSQPVQPVEGSPAEAANGAGSPTAPGHSAETAESLDNLAHSEIRRRMADDFGLKSTGNKAKDIERYLKAKEEAGVVELHSGLGFSPDLKGIGEGLLRSIRNLGDFIKGGSAVRTTKMDRNAGEKLVEHASSSIAAKPIAESLYAKTFGDDHALANRVVEVLTEDNLRGVKDQQLAAGNNKAAGNVHSMVGPKGLWATEAEYQKQLNDPAVLEGIKRWKENVNDWMDQQYRTTQGVAPGQYLPGRGRETGTRLNLLANQEETPATPSGNVSSGGSNPNNPRANFNVFSKQATGASEKGYNTVAKDVIANSVDNVLAKSTRLRAIDAMVKGGVAQFLDKGATWPTNIKGEPVAHLKVDFPGKDGLESRELLFPKSLEPEMRQAMNTDLRQQRGGFLNALNAVQMIGVTDATAHTANIFRGIDQAPGGKSLLHDMAVRGLPGLRTVDTVARLAGKVIDIQAGTPQTKAAIADLARIGAWRGGEHSGAGAALTLLDRAGRLAMNDMFDNLVQRGLKENTDTNRREFVNQVGQYNSRLQSKMTAFLKDSAISPFITAGVNYNRLGAKALIGGHGGEASSPASEALLRSTQIARNVLSPILMGAAITYLATGKAARPGVPFGAVDTGKDDDKGKPVYVDLMGSARRGLNVTGAGKVIEGVQQGRATGDIIDSVKRDVLNSAIHPLAGPAVKFGLESMLGAKPGADLGWATPKAAPGESQTLSDVKHAIKDINPLVKGGIEAPTGAGEKASGVGNAALDSLKSAVGIKSGKVPLSPAAELAQEFYRQRMGDKRYTEEQQQAHDLRTQVTKDVRGGMSRDAAIEKAVSTGKVTSKEALASAKAGDSDWATTTFKRLSAEEAQKVLKLATPDEKEKWQPMYDAKIKALKKESVQPYSGRIKDKEAWKARKQTAAERLGKLGETEVAAP